MVESMWRGVDHKTHLNVSFVSINGRSPAFDKGHILAEGARLKIGYISHH